MILEVFNASIQNISPATHPTIDTDQQLAFVMSALTQKADIDRWLLHVGFVPEADILQIASPDKQQPAGDQRENDDGRPDHGRDVAQAERGDGRDRRAEPERADRDQQPPG